MITRDDIYRLGRDDPAINQAIRLFQYGDCTWEQALMVLVEWYSKDRKNILEMLIDAKLKSPAPVLIGEVKESTP